MNCGLFVEAQILTLDDGKSQFIYRMIKRTCQELTQLVSPATSGQSTNMREYGIGSCLRRPTGVESCDFDEIFEAVESRSDSMDHGSAAVDAAMLPASSIYISKSRTFCDSSSLSYLATGCTFTSLAMYFVRGNSTISDIIERNNIRDLGYPTRQNYAEKWKDIASRFEELWNIPNLLGAIDA
ncbi:hypothetical protein JTB14_021336 [Gonioctena quinquepunctata]|nr:hypothetical protein JTB14_021336 [Gonioctena quinquepunctata]